MRRSMIRKIRQASWRTLVGIAVCIGALVLARPTFDFWLCGLPLIIVGESIRLWGAGHLVKTSELIVSGPYAYVQHPLYLGTGFILTGLLIMGRAPWWLAAVVLVFFFGYYIRRKHRIESGRLSRLYGARYDAYEAAVPVLFPNRRPYRLPDSQPASWNLKLVSRNSEDGTVYGLVLVSIYMILKALWI